MYEARAPICYIRVLCTQYTVSSSVSYYLPGNGDSTVRQVRDYLSVSIFYPVTITINTLNKFAFDHKNDINVTTYLQNT